MGSGMGKGAGAGVITGGARIVITQHAGYPHHSRKSENDSVLFLVVVMSTITGYVYGNYV